MLQIYRNEYLPFINILHLGWQPEIICWQCAYLHHYLFVSDDIFLYYIINMSQMLAQWLWWIFIFLFLVILSHFFFYIVIALFSVNLILLYSFYLLSFFLKLIVVCILSVNSRRWRISRKTAVGKSVLDIYTLVFSVEMSHDGDELIQN